MTSTLRTARKWVFAVYWIPLELVHAGSETHICKSTGTREVSTPSQKRREDSEAFFFSQRQLT